jgi:hypothetical protein
MRAFLRVAVVCCATLLSTGCIVSDVTHTLLIEPGGAVAWVVLERNVRSDSTKVEERVSEEAEYLAAARSSDSAAARALRVLGGDPVAVTVLRDHRPFAVWTEARFNSAADAVERFLAACGISACAHLWNDGAEEGLVLTIEVPDDEDADDAVEGFDMPLPGDVANLEILLTQGTFVSAQGFIIDGDRARLIPISDEELEALGDSLVLSLTWSSAAVAVGDDDVPSP